MKFLAWTFAVVSGAAIVKATGSYFFGLAAYFGIFAIQFAIYSLRSKVRE